MSDFKSYKNFKAVKELNEEGEEMIPATMIEEPEEKDAKTSDQPLSYSAPIKPKSLKDVAGKISETLNERIGDEYKAYYFYRNAANWCQGVNYNKAAQFFEKEASNELEHSKGLQEYLTQWNIVPEIPQAPTTAKFSNLVDVINQAYEMEYGLLEKYSMDQIEFADLHPATFNFIQKYVDIQNEEVSEYSDLLNALELIDYNNKLDILFFEKKYFK